MYLAIIDLIQIISDVKKIKEDAHDIKNVKAEGITKLKKPNFSGFHQQDNTVRKWKARAHTANKMNIKNLFQRMILGKMK